MAQIAALDALEILDSRGRPTVKAYCTLSDGTRAAASVPSGASTGDAEARELRDGDADRYRGLGCRQAVRIIRERIGPAVAATGFPDQAAFDHRLCELDGTPNKAALGANAVLACSLAFARATAVSAGQPLYAHFADMAGGAVLYLPRPTINLFSGGKHAGEQVPIQDVLVVPTAARSMDAALSTTCAVFQAAAELCEERYAMRLLTADEGGLSPTVSACEELLDLAVESIERAGFRPGNDVALALDVASSHFALEGAYQLGNSLLNGEEMVDRLLDWAAAYPIVSIEDGLAQEDWPHWSMLRERAPEGLLVVGDDLLCTNPARIRRAVDARAADTLLLKVNQIGTLTEAAEANRLARAADWQVVVSARSGETEDDWLADLAVGWNGDFIKIGSITQSERLAKYNRLLEIEHETGWTIAEMT